MGRHRGRQGVAGGAGRGVGQGTNILCSFKSEKFVKTNWIGKNALEEGLDIHAVLVQQ